jgi:hypothetical protein
MKPVLKLAAKSIYSLLRIFSHYKSFCSLPEIKADNIEIHILGNGPSLKDTLEHHKVKFFASKICMCVNDIAITDLYEEIKPKYYLLLDPAYWEDDVHESLVELREKLYSAINSKTSWNVDLILPVTASGAYDWTSRFTNNKYIKIHFFHTIPATGFKTVKFNYYKYNLGMPAAQNVLVAAIFLSINIGYKSIFLHGADHSWHEDLVVNDDNIVCIKYRHCYDEAEVELTPFLKGDKIGSTWKMGELFMALGRVFNGYQEIAEYASYRNVKIYNASKVSCIDTFTRYKCIPDKYTEDI